MIAYLRESLVGDLLSEVALLALLVGLYAGLTVLYRAAPAVALTTIVVVAVVTGAGSASLALRLADPVPRIEGVTRAVAVGVLFLMVTAAMLVAPVLLADAVFGRFVT